MPQRPADATIVGGGLAGLAMALALGGRNARPPLDVRLLAAGELADGASAEADSRASAITLSSRRLFEALGVWSMIEAEAEPIRRIVVTDTRLGEEQRPVLLDFGEPDDGPGPSAFLVENRRLAGALAEAVARSPGIAVLERTEARRFDLAGPLARVETDAGTLASSLVIAADGRQSPAREAAGIGTVGWAYGQSAIVTTVEHERPHEGVAEEHFLPAGPFARLPLAGNRSSLVWTEATEEAERILALDEAGFAAELALRFGDGLGEARAVGPRHAYPLGLQIARRFVGPRLALAGDAAHVVHPLAGLGFNLGLRDVAALAECVSDAVRLGLDPGGADVLERYERWRRPDTLLVAATTEGLNRLFSNDSAPLRAVRDLGLGMVDRLPGLKQAFASEAAGVGGHLPRLLTGEPA